MSSQFRTALNNFAKQSTYRQSLEEIRGANGHIAASKLLGMWYLETVFDELALNTEDLNGAWTDGSGDLGCDFIYRDAGTGRVYLLQSKCRDEGKSEGTGDFTEFFQLLDKLRDREGEWREHSNDAIREASREIDWEHDYFICVFLTTARGEKKSQKSFRTHVDTLKERWPRAEFRFVHEDELESQYVASLGQVSKKEVVVEALSLMDAGAHCTVAFLDGSQLYSMYQTGGEHALFASNIRLGMSTSGSRINRGIEDTVRENPESFFFFNNGLTCTAHSIKREEKRLRLAGLQVINGAQTLTTFFRTVEALDDEERNNVFKKLRVLARFIETKDEDFLEDIIVFVNKQNPTHARDFRSREPVIKQYAGVMLGFPQGGKVYELDYRRGAQVESGRRRVKVADFVTRALYYDSDSPYDYGGSVQTLFEEDYYWLALTGGNKPVKTAEDGTVRERIGLWWVSELLDSYLKERKGVTEDYACIAKSVNPAVFAAKVILRHAYGPAETKLLLQTLARGNFSTEGNESTEKMLDLLCELTTEALLLDVRIARAAKDKLFQEKEWRRSTETFERLAKNIQPSWSRLKKQFPLKTIGYR